MKCQVVLTKKSDEHHALSNSFVSTCKVEALSFHSKLLHRGKYAPSTRQAYPLSVISGQQVIGWYLKKYLVNECKKEMK